MCDSEIVDESMKRRMEAAEAKVKELEAALDGAIKSYESLRDDWHEANNERLDLREDNARLRGAMTKALAALAHL